MISKNVEFDAEEFDRRLGIPGLHKVGRKMKSTGRQTLLPGDLARKYENDAFWRDPARDPHQVKVIQSGRSRMGKLVRARFASRSNPL